MLQTLAAEISVQLAEVFLEAAPETSFDTVVSITQGRHEKIEYKYECTF